MFRFITSNPELKSKNNATESFPFSVDCSQKSVICWRAVAVEWYFRSPIVDPQRQVIDVGRRPSF